MRRFVLLLPLMLAACSTSLYSTPASHEQAQRDLTSCRQDANSRLLPQEYLPPGESDVSNNNQVLMQHYTVEKHFDNMVDDCMQSRGYPTGH